MTSASESQVKTWVLITSGWDGMPIAHHLQQEGKEVVVGQVQDFSELDTGSKEKDDEKEARLAQFNGILKKYPAEKLVKVLKKVKNKDEYFIYCDQNNLFTYAEQLLRAGFTKGIFPTEEDYEMEKEREKAMEFVEENYPEVQIIPHEKFSTVEEAKAAVEATECPLVIQSEGDHVSTIVGPDDIEQSKQTILAALEKHAKEYAKGEIIIKEKLVAPIEITPQIVFYNGEPVFTDLDIETKNIGDGENNGNQVGCGTNLIIQTKLDDEINRIAFPEKVYEMAKNHKGIFVWDISLYLTDNGIYFGEFCANRFGYDALFTEMTMGHGPSEFFENIVNLQNPIEHFKFGTAVRVFNLNKAEDQEIIVESWKPTWLFEVQEKEGKMVSINGCWDLGVITGRGNTVEEAIENVYDNYQTLVFKEKYARTKEDFRSDYPTSIIRRFKATNGLYFEAPDFETKKEKLETESAKELQSFKEKVKSKLYGLIK